MADGLATAPRSPQVLSQRELSAAVTGIGLNGGSEYSQLHYVVTLDGKDTNITWHTFTDGSPDYKIIGTELHCGDETWDAIKQGRGQPLADWIFDRIQVSK